MTPVHLNLTFLVKDGMSKTLPSKSTQGSLYAILALFSVNKEERSLSGVTLIEDIVKK